MRRPVVLAVAGMLWGSVVYAQGGITSAAGGGGITPVSASVSAPLTLSQDNIGTTSTDDLTLSNATAAANGAQQWSPRLHFVGAGWNGNTSVSQTFDFTEEIQTVQGANVAGLNAQAGVVWSVNQAGGGYKKAFGFWNNGNNGFPDTSVRNDGYLAVYNTNTPSDFAVVMHKKATDNNYYATVGSVASGGSVWGGLSIRGAGGSGVVGDFSDSPDVAARHSLRLDYGVTTPGVGTISTVLASGLDAALHSPLTITPGTANTASNQAGKDLKLTGGQGSGTGVGGKILIQTASAGGSGTSANALATNLTIYPGVPFIVNVASNFTSAANTNLQTITGLTWTFTANMAISVHFDCYGSYSIATAAVAVDFGVQDASVAPTNVHVTGKQWIATGSAAPTVGTVPTLTTTTATSVTTATPGATGTNYEWELHGYVEHPSNATASAFNIMVKTANSADLPTVNRGSYCIVF